MEWQTVAIFAGLAVLAIMLVISMLARLYRKVGPNEALLVYGRGKTPRVVKGAGTVIWPLIESCRLLSLELMSFDVAPQQDLYTNQGVAVTVEAVAQIKVKSDDISIRTGAEQFLTKTPPQREGLIRLVMEGHLRGIIGQLTVEQIVKEPEMVGVLGRVSGSIRSRGTGEIIFVQEGARKACAARSEEGDEIRRGEEVVVTRFDQGVAYVRRWSELAEKAGVMPAEEGKSL